MHLTLSLAAVAAVIYAIARAAGLADLGRCVDLDERSVGQQAQRQEQLQRSDAVSRVWDDPGIHDRLGLGHRPLR